MAGVAEIAAEAVGSVGTGSNGEGDVVTGEENSLRAKARPGKRGEYNIGPMVVLAIETVTRAGSLALWDGSVCHARAGEPVRTHAERLPGELIDWLAVHGRTLADVDLLVVVTGPGSFTGMRIGIAAVQGLALAAHKRVRGVPTLQALAGAWQLGHPSPALVAACLDGQRGEVFVAGYRVGGESLVDATAEVLPAMVETPEVAGDRIAQAAAAQHVVVVGDGAERYLSLIHI